MGLFFYAQLDIIKMDGVRDLKTTQSKQQHSLRGIFRCRGVTKSSLRDEGVLRLVNSYIVHSGTILHNYL